MIKINMLFWAITIHHIITVLHQESGKSQTIGKNDISKSIYFHVLSSQRNLSRNLKKKLQLSISNLTEPGLGIVASSVGFEHNILHVLRVVAVNRMWNYCFSRFKISRFWCPSTNRLLTYVEVVSKYFHPIFSI